MGGKTESVDKGYIKSGVWKCSKSPTGAHHWIELVGTEKLANQGYFVCIHCNDVTRFPTLWGQVNPSIREDMREPVIKLEKGFSGKN